MSKKFLTTIQLVSLTSDPANSHAGTFYFNSALNKIRYFDGTSWSSFQKENTGNHQVSVSSTYPLDVWGISEYTTLEYTLQIKQTNKIRSSKIMVVTNETLFYYTEYSIIEIGGRIDGLLIDASKSTTPNGDVGQLTIQIPDANTNNAQVSFVRTTLA